MRTTLLAFVLGLLAWASPSSHATVSFYALKDTYDVNSSNPQIYRYDGISNFRSGVQASITTRNMGHGFSSDIAMDEQGKFYFVNGTPTDSSTKTIWWWNSVADWAANTNGGLLGQRSTTFQVSGFSVYQNELYFLEGNPNTSGNKPCVNGPRLPLGPTGTPEPPSEPAAPAQVSALKSMPAEPCGF